MQAWQQMSQRACLMLLQYVQLCGKLWDHQHGAPSQCLLATQDVSIDVVPNIQHLHNTHLLCPTVLQRASRSLLGMLAD